MQNHGEIKSVSSQIRQRRINIATKRHNKNKILNLVQLNSKEKPRILVKRRLGGMGDVLMTTPMLKHIKRILPHCELTYSTDKNYSNHSLATIIEHNPYVDILISNEEAIDKLYDYVIDVTSTGLSREKEKRIPPNRIDLFAEEMGIDISLDPVPDYVITKEESAKAKKFLKELKKDKKDTKIIAIQCRSNDTKRTWPKEKVNQLADILAKRKGYIVLLFDWGSGCSYWRERELIYPLRDLNFSDTAAIVNEVDLVVCPDSSMLHLAGALRKKTVSIFGPIPPQSRMNYYSNATYVVNRLPCSYCWYSTCKRKIKIECLVNLEVEDVYSACIKKINEPYTFTLKKYNFSSATGVDEMKEIEVLIKRGVGGLGDILMIGPGIQSYKRKFPNRRITFAIPKVYIPLMENLDFIDEVVDCKNIQNAAKFRFVHDLGSSCPATAYEVGRIYNKKRIEKNRIQVFSEALGSYDLVDGYSPIYNITEEEKVWADKFLKKKKLDPSKKILAVHLNSDEIYRDYPEKYSLELVRILSKDYNIITIEHSHNRYREAFDATGLEIREWAAILSKCDLFITVDTGPLHVAEAIGVKTFAIFGPIDYKARCRGYKNVTVIAGNLNCSPCWRNGMTECKVVKQVKCYSKCMQVQPNRIKEIVDNEKV